MNDTQIENLLRRAPRPAPPADLRKRLLGDLPVLQRRATSRRGPDLLPLWRRLVPALSFGVLLLGCLIALAVQTRELFRLKRQNEALRAATTDLPGLRDDNAALQSARLQAAAAEQARKDQTELILSRSEVERLREQAAEQNALRAENRRLRAEHAAAAAKAGLEPETDPFTEARKKAERLKCVNNLKQLSLGARIYANDHNDTLPRDVASMKNELNTPRILTCPSDQARQVVGSWEQFDGSSLSYEFLVPGIRDTEDPKIVMFYCRIHHNAGLLDGSVRQLRDESQLTQVDGRVKLAPPIP